MKIMKRHAMLVIIMLMLLLGFSNIAFADYSSSHDRNNYEKSGNLYNKNSYNQHDYVRIDNLRFMPRNLVVREGTRVVWTNYDDEKHTTTSDRQYGNEVWDSGPLSTGKSFSKTFHKPGTYHYHCNIHPEMHGPLQ